MKTQIWLMAPLVLGLLLGCTENQGFPRLGKISNLVNGSDSTQGDRTAFPTSVAQEIAAIDDYFSTLENSRHASSKSLSKKDRDTLKSAKAISQEGKILQKKRKSYRAIQKIRSAKRMIHPMRKKLWKLGDKRTILSLVNQQVNVVKQRRHELGDLVAPGKVKSRKAINARQRSKALFVEAKKLRKNGKLRRAYAQSEDALEVLDKAITVIWRDRKS